MIKLLLVSDRKENLAAVAESMAQTREVRAAWADSLTAALEQATGQSLDLVVVDGTVDSVDGLEVVDKMVRVNPLANYAVVSSLGHDDFHEKSEGLGILMPLPPAPDAEQGKILMAKLEKVLLLSNRTVLDRKEPAE